MRHFPLWRSVWFAELKAELAFPPMMMGIWWTVHQSCLNLVNQMLVPPKEEEWWKRPNRLLNSSSFSSSVCVLPMGCAIVQCNCAVESNWETVFWGFFCKILVHLRKKCQQRGLKRSSDSIVRKQVVCQIKCVACNIMGVHSHSFSARHIFSIFGKFWFCGVMEVSRTLYRLLGTDRWTCRFWGRQLGQIKNRLLFFWNNKFPE